MSAAVDSARTTRLAFALTYAGFGYRSFPLRVRIDTDENGELEKKLFPVLDWPRVATCDREKVESWWGEGMPFASASIGVATAQSGISVVDCDGPEGVAEWQAIRDLYGISDDTPHYSTPGGGEHWWYRTDPERPLPTKAHTIAHGIDTRGGYGPAGTGLVIVPPSTDDRGAYQWLIDLCPLDELPPVPEAVYALIEDRAGKRPRDPEQARHGDDTRRFTLAQAQQFCRPHIDKLKAEAKGGRNTALNDAARAVSHFGGEFWSREAAEARLTEIARERGLDAVEIANTIDSAYKAQARDYASGQVDKDGRALGWQATYVEPSPLGDDGDGEADDPFEADVEREVRRQRVWETAQRLLRAENAAEEALLAADVEHETRRLRIRETAQRVLRTEDMPELSVLDAAAFLKATMPEWLVRGFLYRASTAKVYGPPGGTKSFFLLDVALHLATGRRWHGRSLPRTRVHYVMAEGQAVNTLRTHGWLTHHGVDEAELEGWFTAIPQGILLTPEGIESYLTVIKEQQPGLVILDTKNRMMVGEENSASDVAVMIRAMDAIRETSGACVCLVDHTGILDQTRGRGSNAVTAAMDSEIKVGVGDGIATAEVTRDKAGVVGEKISYRLLTVDDVPTPPDIRPPAVCDPVDVVESVQNPAAEAAWREWRNPALWPLPVDVAELATKGVGKTAIPDVARYMRWYARSRDGAGRNRNEMCRDMKALGIYGDDTVLRAAWDRLLGIDRIWNIQTKSRTAATHWMTRPGDPGEKTEPIEGTRENGTDRETS